MDRRLTARHCLVIFLCFSPVGIARMGSAESINVHFSNFSIGETFPHATLPRTIVADGTSIALRKNNFNSNSANGHIMNASTTGIDPAMFLAAELRAEIMLPDTSVGGTFYFKGFGGSNFVQINGVGSNLIGSSFSGGSIINHGGVIVSSSSVGNGWRSVNLDGLLYQLAFMGQELAIDRIELTLGVPGDFNADRVVDAADYIVWRKSDGSPTGWANWRRHYGVSLAEGSGETVPEPTACSLVALAIGWRNARGRWRLSKPA